jgi:hypothetical protein
VLSHAEREAIVKGYAQLAGFAREQVNRGEEGKPAKSLRGRAARGRAK